MDWFKLLDFKVQAALISSATTIILFFVGWLFRGIYERISLHYRLNKEFQFEQKKKLKEEIAKNKIHLLNAVEEISHRLWNFTQNVGENWHKNDDYYLRSFVYRFLNFLHWTIKTERDTITIDTTVANSSDITFLKYVKTFKDIFTDVDLYENMEYNREDDTNHFYKNNLIGYCKWIVSDDRVIDFDEFITKLGTGREPIQRVFKYFTQIENDITDKSLNTLKCFHLLAINFLNEYGHDYQKTPDEKLNRIKALYKNQIIIKEQFQKFLKKSKLEKEMKSMLKGLK